MDRLHTKLEDLKEIIRSYESGSVAFSGGVDSTFLLKVAREVLGDRVIAVTATSGLFPMRETDETVDYCKVNGIPQIMFPAEEMKIEGFKENPVDRCYHCKRSLFTKIKNITAEQGLAVVMEGSNVDDDDDYRPGCRAILELGIQSPLKEAGLTKAEIRELSKEMGLSTWSKPSFACLASRIPYGEEITQEKLFMIERGEEILSDMGFHQYRVRIHMQGLSGQSAPAKIARIEITPEEFPHLIREDIRTIIDEEFRKIGFQYVTMDLTGYRMGSMNEMLDQ